MNLKNLLPFLTAAAGAGAGYYFLGREKRGDKRVPREGLEPWATAVGGALVGYVAGQFFSSRFPEPAPQLQAPGVQAAPQTSPYVDLDGAPLKALPPARPQIPVPTASIAPDTRADGASDAELLNSLGSLEGTSEDGLGSYEGAYGDVDGIDVEALIKESGMDRN
jgi:hypothetical protein